MQWILDGTEIRDDDGNLIGEFADETFAIIIMKALSDYESLGEENERLKSMLSKSLDNNLVFSDKATQILDRNIQEQSKFQQQFMDIIEKQKKQLIELGNKWNNLEEVSKRMAELQQLKNI